MRFRMVNEVVRGTPFEVSGRVLVPEARVTLLTSREVTLGSRTTKAFGLQLARIQPTAMVEPTAHGERRHRIQDKTRRSMLEMAIAAVLFPLILNTLANRLGKGRQVGRRPE